MFSACSLERHEPPLSKDSKSSTKLDNFVPPKQGRGAEELSGQDIDNSKKSRNAVLENNLNEAVLSSGKNWCWMAQEKEVMLVTT